MGSMKFVVSNDDADCMDVVKLFPLDGSTVVLDESVLRNRNGSTIVLSSDKTNQVEQTLGSMKCYRCGNLHGLYVSVCPWCSYSRSCSPIPNHFNPYIRKADMLPHNTVVLNYDRPSRSFSGMTPTTTSFLTHGTDCICYLKPVVSWTSQKPKSISYSDEELNENEKTKEERKIKTIKKTKSPANITISLAPKQTVKRLHEKPISPQSLPNKLPSLSHVRQSFDDPDYYSSDCAKVRKSFILKRNKNVVIVKSLAMLMLFMMVSMLVCLLVNNMTLSKLIINKNVCSTDGNLYTLQSEINEECGKYLK